jgi:riboflavin synthase
MFTGLVEEVGVVARFERRGKGAYLTVRAPKVSADLAEGDSVNVDGTCLTVISPDRDGFSAEISPETLQRSTVGSYKVGKKVNLERPVTPSSFMGGHIVQGHVDATVKVSSFKQLGHHVDLGVTIPKELSEYIVPKGSIALNGVSLTVAGFQGHSVTVALIPTTLKGTNLGECRRGDILNLELDIIGKYVRSFVNTDSR